MDNGEFVRRYYYNLKTPLTLTCYQGGVLAMVQLRMVPGRTLCARILSRLR